MRGSAEDFEVLFKKNDAEQVYRSQIMFYTKKFIYTNASAPIQLFADNGLKKQYPIDKMDTVSTIGAGDNFNAGFLYGMLTNGITRSQLTEGLSEEQWDSIVEQGKKFSAEVCRSLYNYVSPEFGTARKEELKQSINQE